MVNVGRPSRDCLPCRKRKLKCDLKKEGCGQCRRKGFRCFGYREPNQLIIHDETPAVRQKALVRAHRSHVLAPAGLSPAWEVRARHAFFSHYVFGLSRSYDMLAPLYEHAVVDDHLYASVDAVSLAFLSYHYDAPFLYALAGESYLTAIRRLGSSLQTSSLEVTDATLQSALLLDLYEKIVNRDPLSSASWMSHVNGAMALVHVRGNKNIRDYVSRRLAVRVVITLIISCGAANERIPDSVMGLREQLKPFMDEDDSKWLVTGLVMDVVNLEADVRNGMLTSDAQILAAAKRIDKLFVELDKSLKPLWQPRKVMTASESPLVFGRFYDVYHDHFVTQVRNVSRTQRILINRMIMQYGNAVQSASAATTISKLSQEICASVPQFVLPHARPENRLPFTPLQTLQCYTLIAPLYGAVKYGADPNMRAWGVVVLKHIAEAGNMRTVANVADILEYSPDVSFWNIYSMLGGYAFAA